MILLILLALVVGSACGASLSYEMHTQEADRNSPRHWMIFGGAVLAVSLSAVAAEALNESVKPDATAKAVCVLVVVASIGLSYWLVSRWRGGSR
jgi:uncharacterized membrane-anchored protein